MVAHTENVLSKNEDGEKSRLRRALTQLRKDRDMEARELLEEMQRIVTKAQERASESERSLFREFREFMYSWEREVGRPNSAQHENLADDAKQKYEVSQSGK